MKITEILSLSSVFDLCLIGLLLWRLGLMIKGTRAMSIFVGLIILGTTYTVSNVMGLKYTHKILSYFFDNVILIVILLFQEEIRLALADVGRRASIFSNNRVKSLKDMSEAIATVTEQMAKEHIGGLIVIEREDRLKNIIATGSQLYAQIKPELIYSIFLPNSPIHDGAIVIANGEITAAGCILPLSKDTNLNKKYGTRHRAAIGLTQATDAIVVLISEEAGQVHLVMNGKVNTNLSAMELKQALAVIQSKEQTKLNLIQQLSELVKKVWNRKK
jgi:diadenylate cyclase